MIRNIIDVEATCWNDGFGTTPKNYLVGYDVKRPDKQIQDIIEIGITQIDTADMKIIKSKSYLINPEHSKVSEFCTSLTTLTQALISKEGMSFDVALQNLKKDFAIDKHKWISFGLFDKRLFEAQCKLHKIENPLSRDYENFEDILEHNTNIDRDISMQDLFKKFGITGQLHRGVDDSIGLAKIYIEIMGG